MLFFKLCKIKKKKCFEYTVMNNKFSKELLINLIIATKQISKISLKYILHACVTLLLQ